MTRQNDLVFIGLGVLPVGPAPSKADADLFAALMQTPEGRTVLDYLQRPAPGQTLGTWKIFKKIGKGLKQVGKITRPFTTALAKTFLPSGVVDSLAKADPTTGNKLQSLINKVLPGAQAQMQKFSELIKPAAAAPTPAPGFFSKENQTRNILIFGGVAVAVVGGVLLLGKKSKRLAPGV